MPKYTDEELSMLTDEEREGYDEGQDFDEGEGTPEAKDGAQTTDETPIVVKDDDEGEGADDNAAHGDTGADRKPTDEAPDAAAAADDGAADDAAAQTAAAAKQDEPPATDDGPAARRPTALAQLPEDYDDQVAKIATDKDALVEKFDEGDLTMAEYHKELDELNRRERELERIKDRVDYETRAATTHWSDVVVAGFLDRHTEYRDNPVLLSLLDAEVRKQQAANNDPFDPAYLTNAHKTIKDGLPAMFAAPAKPASDGGKKREIPQVPSLANVPAADVDNPDDGQFAMLDRLADKDPLAFEEALDKLPAAVREEYLAS